MTKERSVAEVGTMSVYEHTVLKKIQQGSPILRGAAANQAVEFLTGSGYLDSFGHLTHQGLAYLQSHEEPLENEGEPVQTRIFDCTPQSPITLDPSLYLRGTLTEVFSHEEYAKLINETVEKIRELSEKKGGEYAGDVDRLANFRRNGKALGLPMETVWAVYAGKHWDAIQQYIRDQREGKDRDRLESIDGRVDDLIVYCLLFKAMIVERTR